MEFTSEALMNFWKPLAGLIAMVLGGAWTVFVYFDKRRLSRRAAAKEASADTLTGSPLLASGPSATSLTMPIMVLLGGAALLIWFATTDTCEVGDVSSERSWVGCNFDGGDFVIN